MLVRESESKETMESGVVSFPLKAPGLGIEVLARTLAFTVKRGVIGPIGARRRDRIIEEGLATPILIEEIEVRTKALGVVQRSPAHPKRGLLWTRHQR